MRAGEGMLLNDKRLGANHFGRLILNFIRDCCLGAIVNIHVTISFIHLFGPAFSPAHERISSLFQGRFWLCGRFRPQPNFGLGRGLERLLENNRQNFCIGFRFNSPTRELYLEYKWTVRNGSVINLTKLDDSPPWNF